MTLGQQAHLVYQWSSSGQWNSWGVEREQSVLSDISLLAASLTELNTSPRGGQNYVSVLWSLVQCLWQLPLEWKALVVGFWDRQAQFLSSRRSSVSWQAGEAQTDRSKYNGTIASNLKGSVEEEAENFGQGRRRLIKPNEGVFQILVI